LKEREEADIMIFAFALLDIADEKKTEFDVFLSLRK
jgi:hypothetical protein